MPFAFGSAAPGALNVLVPSGQRVALPAGSFNRVYVLAAAVGGDVTAPFSFDGGAVRPATPLTIREWQGPVGQWYSPLKDNRMLREVVVPDIPRQTWLEPAIAGDMVTRVDPVTGAVSGIDQIRPAFVKRDEIAWMGTHRHAPDGNQIYIPSYIFMYEIDVPAGATAIRLPANPALRIVAMSAARAVSAVVPARPLYAADLPSVK